MLLPSAYFSSHGRGRWRGLGARDEPVSAGKAGVRRRVERGVPVVFFKLLLRGLFILCPAQRQYKAEQSSLRLANLLFFLCRSRLLQRITKKFVKEVHVVSFVFPVPVPVTFTETVTAFAVKTIVLCTFPRQPGILF
jgi:hypothetical protein